MELKYGQDLVRACYQNSIPMSLMRNCKTHRWLGREAVAAREVRRAGDPLSVLNLNTV